MKNEVRLSEEAIKRILANIRREEEGVTACDKAVAAENETIAYYTEKLMALENDGSEDYLYEVKISNGIAERAFARIAYYTERRNEFTANIANLKAQVEIAEEQNSQSEYNALENEIAEVEKHLAELKAKRAHLSAKLVKIHEKKFEGTLAAANNAIQNALTHYIAMDVDGMDITAQDGETYWLEGDWYLLDCYVSCEGTLEVEFNGDSVASYKDVATGNKALRDFTAAIERGDDNFTFPADFENGRKKTA